MKMNREKHIEDFIFEKSRLSRSFNIRNYCIEEKYRLTTEVLIFLTVSENI